MKVKISAKYINGLYIFMINFAIVFAMWIFLQVDAKIPQTLLIIATFVFYSIYFFKLDLLSSVKNYIVFSSFLYAIFSLSYRHLIGNCGIDYLKLADALLLLLGIKLLLFERVRKHLLNDKLIRCFLALCFLGIISAIVNSASIVDILSTAWVYLRFLGLYVAIVYGKYFFAEEDYKFYIYMSIAVSIVLTPLSIAGNQDDIAGFFGFNGTSAFGILAVAAYAAAIYKFLFYEKKLSYFIVCSLLYFGWGALGENKVPLIFGGVELLAAIFFLRARKKRVRIGIKKILIFFAAPCLVVVSVYILLKYHPEWNYILDIGLANFIKQYTTKAQVGYSQLGRFEIISWLGSNVLDNWFLKLFGIGIGNGMPSEVAGYRTFDYIMSISENNYHDFILTPMYEKYGWRLGYHRSSAAVLYLECGLVGAIIYVFVLGYILKSSIRLLKQTSYRIYGYVGIIVLIYWIAIIFYYNSLFSYNSQLVFFIVVAVVVRKCKECST